MASYPETAWWMLLGFKDKFSYSLGSPRTYYIAKGDFELLIPLSPLLSVVVHVITPGLTVVCHLF